ncbi:hypothetical protein BDZ45DRAFT_746344 [Acephala macrosclerotiorum]|nr:hypothetical protein BDZ45DRAFT_746344 [Acephala macrosclerotiorum]
MEVTSPYDTPHHARSFLDLPVEIRVQIYRIVLKLCWGQNQWYYNMTSTCHQLRLEALPLILMEWNFYRSDLQNLLDWIREGKSNNLQLIQKMTIFWSKQCFEALAQFPIHAADFHNLIRSTLPSKNHQHGQACIEKPFPQDLAQDLDQTDLLSNPNIAIATWNALRSLPISKISISTSESFPSLDLRKIYPDTSQSRSCMISDLGSISHIRNLSKLRHLGFTGFSTTSPDETFSILRSLAFLDSISIKQYDPSFTPLPATTSPTKHLCLTSEVIVGMNPLRSFQLESSSTWRSVVFNRSIMKALGSHSGSLQQLTVTQRHPYPSDEQHVLEILDFVYTSPIPHIALNLMLPSHLTSMDPSHFNPRPTGKIVDILVFTKHNGNGKAFLEVNTGKFLPTAKEVESRKSLYEAKSGQ